MPILIIIISPKSWYRYSICKNRNNRNESFKIEGTYKVDWIKNCWISENKIQRRPEFKNC
jgi:hypothetical protein